MRRLTTSSGRRARGRAQRPVRRSRGRSGTCTVDLPVGPDVFRDSYRVTLRQNGCWQAQQTELERLTGRDAETLALPRRLEGVLRRMSAGEAAALPPQAMAGLEEKTFFGHPRALATLFLTEMWERFSYYGLRAILVLFMVAPASQGGLGLSVGEAAGISRSGARSSTYSRCRAAGSATACSARGSRCSSAAS